MQKHKPKKGDPASAYSLLGKAHASLTHATCFYCLSTKWPYILYTGPSKCTMNDGMAVSSGCGGSGGVAYIAAIAAGAVIIPPLHCSGPHIISSLDPLFEHTFCCGL